MRRIINIQQKESSLAIRIALWGVIFLSVFASPSAGACSFSEYACSGIGNNLIKFENWIVEKIAGQKKFDIDFASSGGFVKINDLRPTITSGDEVVGGLSEIRYADNTGKIKEGSFAIARNPDGAVYLARSALAEFPNIRKYLGDSRVVALLGAQGVNTLTDLIKTADPNVLKAIGEIKDADEFLVVAKAYKADPSGFEKSLKSVEEFKEVMRIARLSPNQRFAAEFLLEKHPVLYDDFVGLTDELKDAFRADFSKMSEESLRALEGDGGFDAWHKFAMADFPSSFRVNATNIKQRVILDEWAGKVASSNSNNIKGNFGEIGADLDLTSKGYESLMVNRIVNINEGGHGGLDGLYRKDGTFFVIEGKFSGNAQINRANPDTRLPRQMSDDWIVSRDWGVVSLPKSTKDLLISTKNYVRVLAKVSPDGTVTYRLIDDKGYAILGNAGIWIP